MPVTFTLKCGFCRKRVSLEHLNSLFCSTQCETRSTLCGRCDQQKPIYNSVHGVKLCETCFKLL